MQSVAYTLFSPGSTVATNSNGFAIQAWDSNTNVSNNLTVGSGIGRSCISCRGIQLAAIGGAVTGVTISHNVEYVTYLANNDEYSGCALGGAYSAQINNAGSGYDVSGNTLSYDTLIATAGACEELGFSDSGSGNATGPNMVSNSTLGCNIDSGTYVIGNVCAGARLDSLQYSPAPDYAVNFNNDTIYGDTAEVFIMGTSARTFQGDTFGKGVHPISGQLFVDFHHGYNVGCNSTDAGGPLYFIDPTFIGGVTAGSNDLATWAPNNPTCHFGYFLQWTYTVTVEQASNAAPISGAAVSITGSDSVVQCCGSKNGTGVYSCPVSENEFAAVTGSYGIIDFNPLAIQISASGCTTGNYSETITNTTTETKQLCGC